MLRLPQGLPAVETLQAEGYAVAEYNLRAVPTDARVVLLLNLMPQKAVTELDIARALSFPDTDVLLLPVRIAGQTYKTTPIEYILSYYLDIESVLSNKLHLSSAPSLLSRCRLKVCDIGHNFVRLWTGLSANGSILYISAGARKLAFITIMAFQSMTKRQSVLVFFLKMCSMISVLLCVGFRLRSLCPIADIRK